MAWRAVEGRRPTLGCKLRICPVQPLPCRPPLLPQHLHAGIRWARLAEPASFSLPYHLHKLSAVVSLELVLNPAMEEVVCHSSALAGLASLRRLTLRGRLPPARRRSQRRALPHLSAGVTHLAAHDLNVSGTDWAQFRQLQSLDLSRSGGWWVWVAGRCGTCGNSCCSLLLQAQQAGLTLPPPFPLPQTCGWGPTAAACWPA